MFVLLAEVMTTESSLRGKVLQLQVAAKTTGGGRFESDVLMRSWRLESSAVLELVCP